MRLLSRLTYANVMSTLALFVALGGGAFAATNFVGAKGVITLCAASSGNVKLLARNRHCAKHMVRVSFNSQGPAGTPGATGAAGAPGTGGTATSYSAGAGLTLSGTTFGADLTELQARLSGSGCAADQALQAVSQAGSPTCIGLHAYAAVAGNDLSHADTAVPPGHWMLFGQMTSGLDGSATTMSCQIDVAGASVATASQYVPAADDGSVSVIGTATTTAKAGTAVSTTCTSTGLPTWSDGQILAVPVAALN